MNRFTTTAYAVAGTCLAILLSIDEDFRKANPTTVTWLSAGVPSSVIAAYAWEAGFKATRYWIPALACSAGIVTAVIGISLYFWSADSSMRNGYMWGGVLAIGILCYKKWWWDRDEPSDLAAGENHEAK